MSSATQRHSRKHAKRACRQKVRAGGERRVTWVHPLGRLHRAIERSLRLIDSTRRVIAASEERAVRPIRTARRIERASHWMFNASFQLLVAANNLADAVGRAAVESPSTDGVSEVLDRATVCCELTIAHLTEISEQLSGFHHELLDGLRSGRLVPEPIEPRRPRIILRTPPLLIAARAFLLHRRSSVRDRIASVPVRRRRQALVVVTDAPRQISRGRAPPSPGCRF